MNGGNSKSNGLVELYRLHKIDEPFYVISVRRVELQHARAIQKMLINFECSIFDRNFVWINKIELKVSCTKFKTEWVTNNLRNQCGRVWNRMWWNRNPRLKHYNVNHILARKFINCKTKQSKPKWEMLGNPSANKSNAFTNLLLAC